MKKCAKCGLEKEAKEFCRHIVSKDGLRSHCRDCQSAYDKERRDKDPVKWRAKSKAAEDRYNRKHRKERSTYGKEWRQTLSGRFSEYKKRNTYGVFEITMEQFDLMTKQKCHYCNKFSVGKDNCGLDRVDSTKGYTLDNVVACCYTCNRMKLDHTQKEWFEHMRDILAHNMHSINMTEIHTKGK